MNLSQKNISLIILGLTSIVCTRLMLMLINDPEGPNLLVVLVMSAVVYTLALPVYFLSLEAPRQITKILLTFLAQVIIVAIMYIFIR